MNPEKVRGALRIPLCFDVCVELLRNFFFLWIQHAVDLS